MTNLITTAGKGIETNLLSGLGGVAPKWMGLGSGSTAPAATDTALTTEYVTGTWSGYARVVVVPTRTTTSVTNDTVQWIATFTAPAAETPAECANFDQLAVGGNMLDHCVFTGVALANGDSIQITKTEQFT